MPFRFRQLDIPGLLLVEPQIFGDDRGAFLELYKQADFDRHGLGRIVQANRSVSARGVVRGLHYQLAPHAQGKLVQATRGEILDIALDLRSGSPTFGRHAAMRLGGSEGSALWIPPGFAHGFCALCDDADVLYLVTGACYLPDAERGINPLDASLGIEWPIAAAELSLSERDRELPAFAQAEFDFPYPGEATAD